MRNEHVDAVVVGSGFGGSVAAYRLAAAGLSVVVLERGKAYAPGSFPRSPAEMSKAFWDPKADLFGLYDVWSFDGCDSVTASGLGGGSLIYANVLLRKDEHWFVHDGPDGARPWPITRADLDPHYDVVEKMLDPAPYPFDRPAYAHTPKTIAVRDAAMELGLDWQLPPLAIRFAAEPGAEPGLGLPIVDPAYGNVHGKALRRTCRLCGECDLGCNDGAKNTLDHTYLSAASHHGADLRTLHEVRAVRPGAPGGYVVDYVDHGVHHDETPGTGVISCDRLVLAAGTFGTTRLLLRNRGALPGLSAALGEGFSGNGDLLTFLLRAKDRSRTREIDASHGPVITSAIRLADHLDDPNETGRGAYIEDGGYPGFVDWLADATDVRGNLVRAARFVIDRIWARLTGDRSMSAEIARLFRDGELSASSLPLLGMGRDVPSGRMSLRDGELDVEWHADDNAEHVDRLRATMGRIADVLGAEFSGLPAGLGKRLVTAHPLGGAAMGRHPGEGVCDEYGEVFGHPGLYIADGSAMPGPVGPNPSLTIAAMADRMSTRMLEAHRAPAAAAVAVAPVATSLSFEEEMGGFVVPGAADPMSAQDSPEAGRLSFRLTIRVDDVAAFLADPEHLACAEGWVEAPCCEDRHPVERGWFNLFTTGAKPGGREIRYRLWYTDCKGQARTLAGWKDVHDGPITRIWRDTSTLYTHLLRGHIPPDDAAVADAAGRLRIRPSDFVATLGSVATKGPHGAAALAGFGRFFAGQLWDVYGPG